MPYFVPGWEFSRIGTSTMVLPSRMVKSACHQFMPSVMRPDASMYVGMQCAMLDPQRRVVVGGPRAPRDRHGREVVVVERARLDARPRRSARRARRGAGVRSRRSGGLRTLSVQAPAHFACPSRCGRSSSRTACRGSIVDHRDAAGHRADVRAEVAADAFVPVPGDFTPAAAARSPRRGRARDVARAAGRLPACECSPRSCRGRRPSRGRSRCSSAASIVRRDLVVQVEVAPLGEGGDRPPAQLVHRRHSLVVEVLGRARRSGPRQCGSRSA